MQFPPHILDEIRARLSVSDVVGRKVALKKKGRELAGLSPFKSEKTPSFYVNDQKGFYHCFSSGEHGDIFTFLMKTEGLSFPEAVQRLAEDAGVALPQRTETNPERRDERRRLLDVVEASARFFQAQLESAAARHARVYLERRGLETQTIANFRLGYAPNSKEALCAHLRERGFSVQDIVLSGMRIAGPDIETPYDRFRNRIMFPIADPRGEVVAFGARALDPNQPAKYLNSPETPLFHKGHLLYNAHRARPAAHTAGRLIVVEGYMDVIALAQAGYGEAVAPLGTALTGEQVQLLWRMCAEPVLCFDGDAAGRRAAHRAIDTVLPHLKAGYSLGFCFLPGGADPDDLIHDHGSEAFGRLLGRTEPLLEALWDREWSAGDWATPERRAQLEARLRDLVAGIADPAVRNHYGRIISDRLKSAWRPAFQERNRVGKGRSVGLGGLSGGRPGGRHQAGSGWGALAVGHSQSLKQSTFVVSADINRYREALLLRTLINHPWFIEEVAEEIAGLNFEAAPLSELRDALLGAMAEEISLDRDNLRNHLEGSVYAPNLDHLRRMATNTCHAFAEPGAERVDVETGWRHTLSLHQQQSLRAQLSEAEREYRRNLDEDALARILELQRLIATIVPKEAAIE